MCSTSRSLEQLETSFDLPFRWTAPEELPRGGPAAGFTEETVRVGGYLDLAAARGTLEISPPDSGGLLAFAMPRFYVCATEQGSVYFKMPYRLRPSKPSTSTTTSRLNPRRSSIN